MPRSAATSSALLRASDAARRRSARCARRARRPARRRRCPNRRRAPAGRCARSRAAPWRARSRRTSHAARRLPRCRAPPAAIDVDAERLEQAPELAQLAGVVRRQHEPRRITSVAERRRAAPRCSVARCPCCGERRAARRTRARENGARSAVPCTSTKPPAPVITTFMSVSQRRVLGVVEIEQRRAADDADRHRGDKIAQRLAGKRAPRRDTTRSHRPARRSAPVIDAQRVPPSACSTSQSMRIVRSPSAARSSTARSDAADQPLDLLRASRLPAFGGLAPRARVGRARQHAVFGGEPALPLALQERRHALLDARRAQHARLPGFDQHRAFGVRREAARDAQRPQLVGAPAACAWLLVMRSTFDGVAPSCARSDRDYRLACARRRAAERSAARRSRTGAAAIRSRARTTTCRLRASRRAARSRRRGRTAAPATRNSARPEPARGAARRRAPRDRAHERRRRDAVGIGDEMHAARRRRRGERGIERVEQVVERRAASAGCRSRRAAGSAARATASTSAPEIAARARAVDERQPQHDASIDVPLGDVAQRAFGGELAARIRILRRRRVAGTKRPPGQRRLRRSP